jgi:hypothetical protein
LEKRHSKAVFKLNDLRADRRLLNAIRDVSSRRTHALMLGDVKKEFQVMDVHLAA